MGIGNLDNLRKYINDQSVSVKDYKAILDSSLAELIKKYNDTNKILEDKKQQLFDTYNNDLNLKKSNQQLGKLVVDLESMRELINDATVSVDDYKFKLKNKLDELIKKQAEINNHKKKIFDEHSKLLTGTDLASLRDDINNVNVSFAQFNQMINELMSKNQINSPNASANNQSSKSNLAQEEKYEDDTAVDWNKVKDMKVDLSKGYKFITQGAFKNKLKFNSEYLSDFKDKYKTSFKALANLKISDIKPNDPKHKLVLKAIFDLMMKMCGLDGSTGLSKVNKYSRFMAKLSLMSNNGENFTIRTADELLKIFDKSWQLVMGEQFFTNISA